MRRIFKAKAILALTVLAALAPAAAAQAQNFTTAAEVKPILAMTKASWIAVRPYDGNDLLYFTNLLAWRCGVSAISYGVNGAPPEPLIFEPCYDAESSPNALKMDQGVMPFVSLPLDSIVKVTLVVIYDDGTEETVAFARAAVLIQ